MPSDHHATVATANANASPSAPTSRGRRNGRGERPESLQRIIDDRNYHRRAWRALAQGIPKLEWAGEVCGRMNWTRPEEAVLHARRATFGNLYDGLPLCEVESAMAMGKRNSLVALVAYGVVAPVIRKQLEASVRDRAPIHRAGNETPEGGT